MLVNIKIVSLLEITCAFVVLLCQLSNVQAQTPPSVIALFGDSITVGRSPGFGSAVNSSGYGVGRVNYGAPALNLSTILNNSDRPSIVVNWGASGSPSGGNFGNNGVGRIGGSLAQTRSTHAGSAYYVLIMYGTNDFDFGLSTSDTGFFIRQMIQLARGQGYIPVVGTIIRREDGKPSSVYASAIASAAAVSNAPLVNQRAIFDNAGGRLYDRLHPDQNGYQILAQGWFKGYLENAIELEPEPVIPIVSPIIMLLLDDEL